MLVQTLALSMDESPVAFELELPRDPERLVATVAEELDLARGTNASALASAKGSSSQASDR